MAVHHHLQISCPKHQNSTQSNGNNIINKKKNNTRLKHYFHIIFLLSLFIFTLASLSFFASSTISHFLSTINLSFTQQQQNNNNNTISCDRTQFRTDVCYLRGDIRTRPNSSGIFLSSISNSSRNYIEIIKIRPYPRKWETPIMSTIHELNLETTDLNLNCDVRHNATAVVFAAGGYTGNLFHEFNEGIIPLYITSEHFDRNVVFVVSEYKNWWFTKYGDVMSRLSRFRPIDFLNDSRTHCFSEAIVGLQIHGDLTVDPERMVHNKSIEDFRRILDEAYRPRIRSLELIEKDVEDTRKPKLVIISRTGSRVIENEDKLVTLAEEIGFRVEILRPDRTTELAKIYRVLNSTEAMVGVHGAAMTHFLFLKRGSVFIQVVPLGTDWAAETYYGEPAKKLGLWYLGYKIAANESSLCREYDENDPVIRDPKGVNAKGWGETKRVYLDVQNVRLDLERFRRRLERAYWYLVSKRRANLVSNS